MDQPSGSSGVAFVVRGVRLRVDWSFLVLVGLVFWSLDAGVFPQAYPELSTAGRAALALVGTVLLVGSLTLHELCHSWQSLREGIPIREITLWMLGGASQVAKPVESPGAELRIVAAGPACTAVLTVAFLGGAGALLALGAPHAVAGVVFYAAWINLVLLVFNLVPALPLDGGRLLHALLWRRCGDRDRATVQAGTVGQVLAVGLMATGVFLAAASDAVSGLWAALVGMYLFASARREVTVARRSAWLQSVPAGDLLAPGSVVLDATSTLEELTELIWSRPEVHALAVAEADRLVGALVLIDAGSVPIEARGQVRVEDVMLPIETLPGVPADASAREVVRLVQEGAKAVVVLGVGLADSGVVTEADLESYVAGRSARPLQLRRS